MGSNTNPPKYNNNHIHTGNNNGAGGGKIVSVSPSVADLSGDAFTFDLGGVEVAGDVRVTIFSEAQLRKGVADGLVLSEAPGLVGPNDLSKRTAKTDLFVPTAPGPNAKYQEFDTLRSMNGWEQRFVTPPGVAEEVHGASGGSQIRLSMIQGEADKDYIRRWMNARPETIGLSDDNVRFANHTAF